MVNREVLAAVRAALQEQADAGRGAGAQAYMKSAIPSLGVTVPDVRRLTMAAAAVHPFESPDQLRETVLELWREAKVREERYAAVDLTRLKMAARDPAMLAVYEEIIRTGAWWDFVDGVAPRLCGLLQAHRPAMTEVLLNWSRDGDFWIRRASITAQLKAKATTDRRLLREVIEANLGDRSSSSGRPSAGRCASLAKQMRSGSKPSLMNTAHASAPCPAGKHSGIFP